MRFKRVLLKISGEALMGADGFGVDMNVCRTLALEIKKGLDLGAELCLVIGGGNIFRGMKGVGQGLERAQADYMGMLATVMNALAFQGALESIGVSTRVQSGIEMHKVCEPFIRRRALRHLEKGRVVIFAAGTGSPYFTTDTGAALRAVEMNCDAMFKGTQVDGVYSSDPKNDPDAERYDRLGFDEILHKNLRVMDQTAVSLLKDNNTPIVVFSIHEPDALANVLKGDGVFTIVDL